MATFRTISDKTAAFLEQKGTKLSNKRAYLYYLIIPFNDWEDELDTKPVDFIRDTINKLEIELELALLNDQYGGGKKIYVEKYVKDTNINNANIVINFDNVDLLKINTAIKMLKHFLHLDKIPRWFYQQNVPNAPWNEIYNPVDEYNEIGSRYSAKTFMIKNNPIGKSCAISLLVNKPIFIIAVQKMGKDIRKGVFKNIQNTLNDMNKYEY